MHTISLQDLCAIAVYTILAETMPGARLAPWMSLGPENRWRGVLRVCVQEVWQDQTEAAPVVVATIDRITRVIREGLSEAADNERIRVIFHNLDTEQDVAKLLAESEPTTKKAWEHSVRVVDAAVCSD